MAQGGDTYEKYQVKRRADGKLSLENPIDDVICKYLAEGEEHAEIVRLLAEHNVTIEQIDQGLKTIVWERRIRWLRKERMKADYEPTTPHDKIRFASDFLVKTIKSEAEVRDKISAAKALVDVAKSEFELKPPETATPAQNEALAKLIAHKQERGSSGAA